MVIRIICFTFLTNSYPLGTRTRNARSWVYIFLKVFRLLRRKPSFTSIPVGAILECSSIIFMWIGTTSLYPVKSRLKSTVPLKTFTCFYISYIYTIYCLFSCSIFYDRTS